MWDEREEIWRQSELSQGRCPTSEHHEICRAAEEAMD